MDKLPGSPLYTALTFGQLLRRTARHSTVYTFGVFAQRFAGLLLIPLYWRYLDPADYGIIAVGDVVIVFFGIFLGLGLPAAITRFYYLWPEAERRDRLGSLWVLNWVMGLVVGLPVWLWGEPVMGLLFQQVPFHPYLRLALSTAIFSNFSLAALMTLRILERPRQYVAFSLATFGLKTALSIWLVVGLGWGVLGMMSADVIAAAVMSVAAGAVMASHARLTFKWPYVADAVSYSLPLVPSAFLESLTEVADRFFLEKYVTLTALGIYSVADSIAGSVRSLNVALKTTWIPFQMRAYAERRADAPTVISKMANYFVLPLAVATVGLGALIEDLVFVIGVDKYKPVAGIVPLFLIPYFVLALGLLMGNGLAIVGKTQYSWIPSAANLLVMLVAYPILIGRFGLHGAILATLLGYFARSTLAYLLSQRYYAIPFDWPRIVAMIAAGVVAVSACRWAPIPPSLAGGSVRGFVVLLYAGAILYLVGGRQAVRRIVTRPWQEWTG